MQDYGNRKCRVRVTRSAGLGIHNRIRDTGSAGLEIQKCRGRDTGSARLGIQEIKC